MSNAEDKKTPAAAKPEEKRPPTAAKPAPDPMPKMREDMQELKRAVFMLENALYVKSQPLRLSGLDRAIVALVAIFVTGGLFADAYAFSPDASEADAP